MTTQDAKFGTGQDGTKDPLLETGLNSISKKSPQQHIAEEDILDLEDENLLSPPLKAEAPQGASASLTAESGFDSTEPDVLGLDDELGDLLDSESSLGEVSITSELNSSNADFLSELPDLTDDIVGSADDSAGLEDFGSQVVHKEIDDGQEPLPSPELPDLSDDDDDIFGVSDPEQEIKEDLPDLADDDDIFGASDPEQEIKEDLPDLADDDDISGASDPEQEIKEDDLPDFADDDDIFGASDPKPEVEDDLPDLADDDDDDDIFGAFDSEPEVEDDLPDLSDDDDDVLGASDDSDEDGILGTISSDDDEDMLMGSSSKSDDDSLRDLLSESDDDEADLIDTWGQSEKSDFSDELDASEQYQDDDDDDDDDDDLIGHMSHEDDINQEDDINDLLSGFSHIPIDSDSGSSLSFSDEDVAGAPNETKVETSTKEPQAEQKTEGAKTSPANVSAQDTDEQATEKAKPRGLYKYVALAVIFSLGVSGGLFAIKNNLHTTVYSTISGFLPVFSDPKEEVNELLEMKKDITRLSGVTKSLESKFEKREADIRAVRDDIAKLLSKFGEIETNHKALQLSLEKNLKDDGIYEEAMITRLEKLAILTRGLKEGSVDAQVKLRDQLYKDLTAYLESRSPENQNKDTEALLNEMKKQSATISQMQAQIKSQKNLVSMLEGEQAYIKSTVDSFERRVSVSAPPQVKQQEVIPFEPKSASSDSGKDNCCVYAELVGENETSSSTDSTEDVSPVGSYRLVSVLLARKGVWDIFLEPTVDGRPGNVEKYRLSPNSVVVIPGYGRLLRVVEVEDDSNTRIPYKVIAEHGVLVSRNK